MNGKEQSTCPRAHLTRAVHGHELVLVGDRKRRLGLHIEVLLGAAAHLPTRLEGRRAQALHVVALLWDHAWYIYGKEEVKFVKSLDKKHTLVGVGTTFSLALRGVSFRTKSPLVGKMPRNMPDETMRT
jgi:hypothetical protein